MFVTTRPFATIDFDLQAAAIEYSHAHALALNIQFDAINRAHEEAIAINLELDAIRLDPATEWESVEKYITRIPRSTLGARNAQFDVKPAVRPLPDTKWELHFGAFAGARALKGST